MTKLEIMGAFEDCIQELEILNHTPRSLKTIRLKYVCVLRNLLRGWHSPKYNELPLTSINIRVEYTEWITLMPLCKLKQHTTKMVNNYLCMCPAVDLSYSESICAVLQQISHTLSLSVQFGINLIDTTFFCTLVHTTKRVNQYLCLCPVVDLSYSESICAGQKGMGTTG